MNDSDKLPTREQIAEALHTAWANGVSSWEDDAMIHDAFLRQADAVLALLQRREGGRT